MITPYIVFNRQCESAMDFYERIFYGKDKKIMRYGDYVPEGVKEDVSNYILHGQMTIYGTPITFADEVSKSVNSGSMVHLTINPKSSDEGTRIYNELKDAGEVLLPPTKTFYSPLHVIVKDKFGILWNIIVIDA